MLARSGRGGRNVADAAAWVGIFIGVYAAAALLLARHGGSPKPAVGGSFFAIGPLSSTTFTLGATITALPAFFILGYPALIRRDGLAAAILGATAIGIALVAVATFKRLWLVGQRHGHATLGDVLARYFGNDAIRLPLVVIGLAFAIPFLAMQLLAAGAIVEFATGGEVDRRVGAAAFGILLVAVLGKGGFRTLARLGAVQGALVAAGITVAVVAAVTAAGGIGSIVDGLSAFATSGSSLFATTGGRGGGDFHAFFAVAGTMPAPTIADATPAWTVALGFSAALAAVGLATSPAYCQWPLGAASPRPFAPHTIWGPAVAIGLVLVLAAVLLGLAGRMPGRETGSADIALLVDDLGLAAGTTFPPLLRMAASTSAASPWIAGLIVVAAIAATQAVGALALMAGAIVPREIGRWAGRAVPADAEAVIGRAAMLVVLLIDFGLIAAAPDSVIRYGGLALAFGLQVAPLLVAALWLPWITRQGAVAGVVTGLVVAILAETQGPLFAGIGLPSFGRWPLGIHPAAWGLAAHLVVLLLVSAITQDRDTAARHAEWHRDLDAHAGLSPERRPFFRVAVGAAVLWAFLAVGPGVVIGNDVFSAPENGRPGWTFGIPSIWAWHILMWLSGVALVVALGRRFGLATIPPATADVRSDTEAVSR